MDNPDDEPGPPDKSDEAFLFAISHVPQSRSPVTLAEEAAITVWSQGRASKDEEALSRAVIRNNLTAQEFMLSLRLEQAAAAAPPVPRRVSRAIQRQIGPSPGWHFSRSSVGKWQLAGVGAMAMAAIVLMVATHHPSEPTGGRFQVTSLSDRSILDEQSGSVTRGATGQAPAPKPTRAALEFSEFDVPLTLLKELFADGARRVSLKAAMELLRDLPALAHVAPDDLPGVKLDEKIEALVRSGASARMLTLRAYDLTNPANVALRQALQVSDTGKILFIALAP